MTTGSPTTSTGPFCVKPTMRRRRRDHDGHDGDRHDDDRIEHRRDDDDDGHRVVEHGRPAAVPRSRRRSAQIVTRGAAGRSDEFIELYNPTASDVTLDSSWSIQVRANDGTSYTARWTGSGGVLPAGGHFLLTGSAYADPVPSDDTMTGIKDASSVVLQQGSTPIDAVCFVWASSQTYDATFTCEGAPADNTPHDDTTNGDVDQSLIRKGNGCTDTGQSAQDFEEAHARRAARRREPLTRVSRARSRPRPPIAGARRSRRACSPAPDCTYILAGYQRPSDVAS